MNKYTSDWKKEDQPRWSIRTKKTSTAIESKMSTSSQPFVWVETGTSKRWRVLSPGWRSKTQPGTLETRQGAGKALGFYKQARPGIQARKNLETLADQRRTQFGIKTQGQINAASQLLFSD